MWGTPIPSKVNKVFGRNVGRTQSTSFAQKLYRMLFVFPPAMSLRVLRNKARSLGNKLTPIDSKDDEVAPLVHPIDLHYGIETGGFIGFEKLQSGKTSDVFCTAYVGSRPEVIRKALHMLQDHRGLTFLDLGCGKGRALAVASEFPFRRIVGVELAPVLAAAARTNAEIMRRRFPDRTPIEVIEGDASATTVPDGPLVIYLFHPFYRKIMKGVVRNLEKWLLSAKSKAFVVYYNPVYFDLLDKSRLFRRVYAGMIDFEPNEEETKDRHQPAADPLAIWQSAGEPTLEPHPHAAARIQIVEAGWETKVVW
jgi:SAM-dependent methyltransferase